ncbi:MAG: hypothetical protein LBT67_03120, partial [Holosporaceae bacterium]|nr:hypothetical protein [Holosporaceae bacterium]
MAKIMFFAHDPGGCNAILPLMDAFRLRNHRLLIYATGPAAAKIPGAKNLSFDYAENILAAEKPDFIITGTSANDFTEKLLWKMARNYAIPTMALLDHWCNYGVRFSKYGLKDISKYNFDKTFGFLPSFICVMDDFAKGEMQNEGIPPDIIYSLGNPHFVSIKHRAKNVDVEKIRSKFSPNKQIVTFASEPYEEDYGVAPERKVLHDVAEILATEDDVILVVKLHPKEPKNKYRRIDGVFFDN